MVLLSLFITSTLEGQLHQGLELDLLTGQNVGCGPGLAEWNCDSRGQANNKNLLNQAIKNEKAKIPLLVFLNYEILSNVLKD